MKKYLKITLLVVVAAIFIGTFIFLYQKSKPKTTVYETITSTNSKTGISGYKHTKL